MPTLKTVVPENPEVDSIIADILSVGDALERNATLALPQELSDALNFIAEKPEAYFVSKRDIRTAGGASELVVFLEPTPALRSFMAAVRAWMAENDVIDILDVTR